MKKHLKKIVIVFAALMIIAGTMFALTFSTAAANYYSANYGRIYTGNSKYCNLGNNWAFDSYYFTPGTTGTYRFYSSGASGDPYGFVCTSGNYNTVANSIANEGCKSSTAQTYSLAYDDDSNGNRDFFFTVYLNAGENYYFIMTKYSTGTTSYTAYLDGPHYNGYYLDKQGGSGGSDNFYGGYRPSNPGAKTNSYYYTVNGVGNYTATSAIAIPSKTGYDFQGYYTSTNGGGTQMVSASGGISGNAVGASSYNLYAYWTRKTTSISLNKQSGSGGSSSLTATYGYAMPTISVPTRTGYTFGGYYSLTGGGGTQYYNASGTSVRGWYGTVANYTLYAYWIPKTYTVAYNGNGATSGSMSASSRTYGTAANLRSNAYARTGYTFAGWSTASNGGVVYSNGQSTNNLITSGTYNLYAVWTPNNYTIVFNGNGATSGSTANQ